MKKTIFKAVLFSVLTLFIMSCEDDSDGMNPSEQQQEEEEDKKKEEEKIEELTKEQKEFVELLKSKYPTQTVNFITDLHTTGSAPYITVDKATFTFSNSGMLSIDNNPEDKDGDEVALISFVIENEEYVWKDADKNLTYSLSIEADGTIKDMKVSRTNTNLLVSKLIVEIVLEEVDTIKQGLIGGSILNGELKLTKTVSTFVGKKGVVGNADGTGENASFTNPNGITTDGDHLYIIERLNEPLQFDFNLRKINIATKKVTTVATITGLLPSITGITNDGIFVYIASNKSVTKIKIADGTVSTLATFDVFVEGVTFYNKTLYVTANEMSTIYVVDADKGTSTKQTITGITAKLNGITTDGSFLYAASSSSNKVFKIDIKTYLGVFLSTSDHSNVEVIATDGVNVYIGSPSSGSIKKINIATGVSTLMFNTIGYVDGPFVAGDFSKQGSFGYPTGITSDGKSLYVSEGLSPLPNGQKNNAIRKIE